EPVPALDDLVVPLGGQVALRRDHAALARAGGRTRHRGALGQRHLGFKGQRAEAHPGDEHGNVELERMAGEAPAEHRLGLGLLPVGLDEEAGQGAREEHQLVPVRDPLEHREAAHPVPAELGLDVDVVDDLGREDAAVPERGPAAVFDCAHVDVALLQDELALGRLEVVVVPELTAAHELAPARGGLDPVDAELPGQELVVGRVQAGLDAVDAERGDLAAYVDRAVVHRVAQAAAYVAADDLAAALEHEAGHRAGVPAHDDRAALLVDAGPGADVAAHHHVAAAQRGAGQRAGVLVDEDDAGHHVLGHRPADPPGDVDLGPVDEAAAEVAEAALDDDPAAGQDAHREGVPGARVADGHLGDALVVDEAA